MVLAHLWLYSQLPLDLLLDPEALRQSCISRKEKCLEDLEKIDHLRRTCDGE